jgi:hypothetical protein
LTKIQPTAQNLQLQHHPLYLTITPLIIIQQPFQHQIGVLTPQRILAVNPPATIHNTL